MVMCDYPTLACRLFRKLTREGSVSGGAEKKAVNLEDKLKLEDMMTSEDRVTLEDRLKPEDIIMLEDRVKLEDRLKLEDRVKLEDRLKDMYHLLVEKGEGLAQEAEGWRRCS